MKMTQTLLVLFLTFTFTIARAQEESWHDKLKLLTYSPRYFGANAFPLPELQSDNNLNRWEVEVRGEYHEYDGDRAKNISGRISIPIVGERVGIEVSYVFYEYYNTTQETVLERNAAGKSWKSGAHGDVILSVFYKMFRNNSIADILLETTLKTASGNRLADARYTDAASYWFDMNIGRNLLQNARATSYIRLQGLAGFYCWMTNDIVHRQDDAFLYAVGLSGRLKNLTAHTDLAGFYGYLNNGDRPLLLRTKLNYEYKKNILSFRYKHGIHDYLYDTFSVAYIRCF